jgi:DNA invertase Pin-like site-specific DNA recombinase
MNSEKITILYSRLSRDDELQGQSASIENQEAFLEDYAKKNGFIPYVKISEIKLRNLIQINFRCSNKKAA